MITVAQQPKRNKVIALIMAGALFISSLTFVALDSLKASAFDGDFDSRAYDTWDGITYDFSWYEGRESPYVITTAAQFATLPILTNDLTDGFATWAGALPAECSPYLGTCDNFAGKQIVLAADIDLAGNYWLPISYIFKTPNITNDMYPALEHVPAYLTAVDPWVGDGDGNMIITRYLEFPEAELRFRDLSYIDDDSGRDLADKLEANRGSNYTFVNLYSYPTGVVTYDKNLNGLAMDLVDNRYISANARDGMGQAVRSNTYNIADTFVRNYHFASVYDYADNKGFAGEFDGQNHCVIGVKPKTPWTSDLTERLHTYDPIGMGLFSSIDVDGTIRNLNIKHSILDDDNVIASYSGALCAYNYGTITNCYVHGELTDAAIEMIVPLARKYGKYSEEGDIITPSEYELSSTGYWTPSIGGNGIMCSQNYGLIEDCTIKGKIFTMRDCGGCCLENNGTIRKCKVECSVSGQKDTLEGRANVFHTDEWDTTGTFVKSGLRQPGVTSSEYTSNNFKRTVSSMAPLRALYEAAHAAFETHKDDEFWTQHPDLATQWDRYDLYEWSQVSYDSSDALAPFDASAVFLQGCTTSGDPWIPYTYEPQEGQSIAANHLYGIYGCQVIGGVCAYNNDTITLSDFTGSLSGVGKRSSINRREPGILDNSTTSYIRNTNCYGLFTTQMYEYYISGGITGMNYGIIEGCKSTCSYYSDVSTRGERDVIRRVYDRSDFGIVYSTNGFYRNDCIVYGDYTPGEMPIYNPGGLQWWFPGTMYEDGGITETYTTMGSYFNAFVSSRYTNADGTPFVNPYSDDEIVNSVTYKYMGVIENMPYPYYRLYTPNISWTFTGSVFVEYNSLPHEYNVWESTVEKAYNNVYTATDVSCLDRYAKEAIGGVCAYNFNTIKSYTEDGVTIPTSVISLFGVSNACAYISYGKGDTLCLIEGVEVLTSSADMSNISYKATNTSIKNCSVTNNFSPVGKDPMGLVYEAYSTNSQKMEISNNEVIKGRGLASTITGRDDNHITMNMNVVYDTVHHMNDDIANLRYVDVSDLYNFQRYRYGLLSGSCINLDNIYNFGAVYYKYKSGSTEYTVGGNGIGDISIDHTCNNLYFCGSAANDAIGSIHPYKSGTRLEVNNVYCYTFDSSSNLNPVQTVLEIQDADVKNIRIFTLASDTVLKMNNCTVEDVIAYVDTPVASSSNRYIFRFDNCNCKDMLLESKVNITWAGITSTQALPGLLKAPSDTNVFENVVVQTPNGAITYPTTASMLEEDESIKSDAKLVYDPDARVTGALAYWADHGDSPDRTYNYTVAKHDVIDLMPERALELLDADKLPWTTAERNLPVYTRKIENDDELPYYRIYAPYTSAGAGELVLTLGDQQTNEAYTQQFKVTSVYGNNGDDYTLRIRENNGYGILGLYEIKDSTGTVSLPVVKDTDIPFTINMEDVTYDSEWAEACAINVETVPGATITTSASRALPHTKIDFSILVTASNKEVDEIYYYDYKKDLNNNWILDTTRKHTLSMSDLYITMPNNPIMIGCKLLGTTVTLNEFILGGSKGEINNDLGFVDVYLDSSVDITNVAPDSVKVSGAIRTTPDIAERVNFTSPVLYTFTAENGNTISYSVNVHPLVDGEIAHFSLYGYNAVIDQEERTIKLTLPTAVNLAYASPDIKWSGSSISAPTLMDLSDGEETIAVVASNGDIHEYHVIVTSTAEGRSVQELSGILSDGTSIVFTVDEDKQTITAEVPYGTDISRLVVNKFAYSGLRANIAEGSVLKLNQSNYVTVMSPDGETLRYRLYVKELPDTTKKISQVSIYGFNGVIDENNKTITITIPSKYPLEGIAPDVVTFTGKSIENPYGVYSWSIPVEYTVTAYDGSTATYTVTVIRE